MLAEEKRSNHPLVWRQEFEAEFTSLDAAALIDVTKLLQSDGEPWPEPERLDLMFVVIDSAIKTGASADGTAALFCAVTGQHPTQRRLWLLDYDIVQVTAGVLEPWFDGVVARAREIMGKRTLMPGQIYVEDACIGPDPDREIPAVHRGVAASMDDRRQGLAGLRRAELFQWRAGSHDRALLSQGRELQGRRHQPSLDPAEQLRARGQTSVEAR